MSAAHANNRPRLHLVGTASYKAVGRCLVTNGAMLDDAAPDATVRVQRQRVHGTVPVVLDYNEDRGDCTLALPSSSASAPLFLGACSLLPPGDPYPLEPVTEPRHNRDLLPFIVYDTLGFGGMNGYLVFAPNALDGLLPPLGLIAHFVYTSGIEGPPPHGTPSRWVVGDGGPDAVHCIYVGTMRLGKVPIF